MLTKNGFAVRLSDGGYRGVYRDYASARLVSDLATVCEFAYWNPPAIEPCTIRRWKRFGAKAVPMKEERHG